MRLAFEDKAQLTDKFVKVAVCEVERDAAYTFEANGYWSLETTPYVYGSLAMALMQFLFE